MTTEELTQAIELNEQKASMLRSWLLKYYNNPYREKVRRDLNATEVELETKRFNLKQVMGGLPSHGEQMPYASGVDQSKEKPKTT